MAIDHLKKQHSMMLAVFYFCFSFRLSGYSHSHSHPKKRLQQKLLLLFPQRSTNGWMTPLCISSIHEGVQPPSHLVYRQNSVTACQLKYANCTCCKASQSLQEKLGGKKLKNKK
jgi:hypothetical protein